MHCHDDSVRVLTFEFIRDQELRFTVHDSPDYYQLKISIFTDDKRTDLIGDAWVDLKNIIIPGGGQGDVWQNLTCRGKYAGEIRMEMTFYDSRPKPEKPLGKARPQPAAVAEDTQPKQQKAPMKRRPLPSDPVTGEAPAAQATQTPPIPVSQPPPVLPQAQQAIPPPSDHHQTPPRGHPKHQSLSQLTSNHSMQSIEQQNPQPTRHHQQDPYNHSPSPHSTTSHGHSHTYSTPPRMEVARQPPRQQEQYEAPPRMEVARQPPRQQEQHYETPPRQYDSREYSSQAVAYQYPPHDPRGHQNSAPPEVYNQVAHREPPRQALPPAEVAPPPPPAHRSRHNSSSQDLTYAGYDTSPQRAPTHGMRHDVLKQEAHRHSMPSYPGRPAFREYDSAPAIPNMGQPQREPSYEQALTRHHSHEPSFENHYRSLQPTVEDVPEHDTQPMSIPRRQQHRRSTHDEMFYEQGVESNQSPMSRSPGAAPRYSTSPAAHNPVYDHRALPPSTNYSHTNGASSIHIPPHEQRALPAPAEYSPADYAQVNGISPVAQNSGYDQRALPAPVDYSHQNGSAPMSHQSSYDQRALPAPSGYSHANGSSQAAYSPPEDHFQAQGHELVPASMARQSNYGAQALPASLVPGLDPALSQEIAERIYEDRRQDRRYSTQNSSAPPRGRHMIEAPPTYNPTSTTSHNYAHNYTQSSYSQPAYDQPKSSYTQPTYDQPIHEQPTYERRPDVTYSGGPEPQTSYSSRRSVSPNPAPQSHNEKSSRRSVSPMPSPNNQLVMRRSVSPNPNPSPQHQIRRKSVSPAPPQDRSSAIPFGPDSYNAFNSSLPSSQESLGTDPDAKIITHDGREIDPSDHLPMESWAPEPEAKKPSPEPTRGRPSPAGAQPMPPSGRRQLRIAARPAQPSPSATPSYGQRGEPNTPPTSRNRLHKKSRNSAPPGTSPLAPTPDNYQDRQPTYRSREAPRSGGYDYSGENHAPGYGGAPPIPAKVPIMSGANGGASMALMEEMSRIDIGAGRSRRRGGY
mgnify:CR=1 FL=1